MGAVVARNGFLDRLNDAMKANGILNPLVDIAIWVAIIFLRQTELGDKFDIFYIPVLTVATIDLLNRVKPIRKGFVHLGKQSTNMWLIHPFCCYYFGALAKIVSAPRYAVLSLLTLIAMTYALSLLVSLFWGGLELAYGKVKGKICGRRRAVSDEL